MGGPSRSRDKLTQVVLAPSLSRSDSSSELHRAKEQDQNPPVQNVVTSTTWTDVAKPEGNLVPTKRRLKRQRVDHRDLDVLEEGWGLA